VTGRLIAVERKMKKDVRNVNVPPGCSNVTMAPDVSTIWTFVMGLPTARMPLMRTKICAHKSVPLANSSALLAGASQLHGNVMAKKTVLQEMMRTRLFVILNQPPAPRTSSDVTMANALMETGNVIMTTIAETIQMKCLVRCVRTQPVPKAGFAARPTTAASLTCSSVMGMTTAETIQTRKMTAAKTRLVILVTLGARMAGVFH